MSGSGWSNPSKSGLVDCGRGVAEVELRLAAGDPHQADELDLFVVLERAAEELELPVGTAADVEHPVGPAPLVDDDEPAVVGERLLARAPGRRGRPGLVLARPEAANAWTR